MAANDRGHQRKSNNTNYKGGSQRGHSSHSGSFDEHRGSNSAGRGGSRGRYNDSNRGNYSSQGYNSSRGNNSGHGWAGHSDRHEFDYPRYSSSNYETSRFSGGSQTYGERGAYGGSRSTYGERGPYSGSLPKSFEGNSKDKFKFQRPDGGAKIWMGTPLDELKRASHCADECEKLSDTLMQSSSHTFLGDNPYARMSNETAKPSRSNSTAFSSRDHVSLPHIAVGKKSEVRTSFTRWDKIKNALKLQIGNFYALQKVIWTCSDDKLGKLNILEQYFQELDLQKELSFFEDTLPEMAELALQLPLLFPKNLPILKQMTNTSVTLSQKQVACLLANAFFCTFPNDRDVRKRSSEINFSALYSDPQSSHRKLEKLKCLINYFELVTKNMPSGNVTYARQFEQVESAFWFKMEKQLTNLHVATDGTIEDVGTGMLQVDFANKFVGGGVLRNGLVQEEIRFVLCPEMIVSRLITEVLTDNEALVMTGCERFNNYTGYSDTFVFKGNHKDTTESDKYKRRSTQVVAMDALVFRDAYKSQFEKKNLLRELNKAYCAFKGSESSTVLPAVCTGNWGCGAFGGDKQLKALIQMVAACAASRDVCYLTFGDTELCSQFSHAHQVLKESNRSISNILKLALEYGDKLNYNETKAGLFEYIEKRATGTNIISSGVGAKAETGREKTYHESRKEENFHKRIVNESKSGEESSHENKRRKTVNGDRRGEENYTEAIWEGNVDGDRRGKGNFTKDRWEENVDGDRSEKGNFTKDHHGDRSEKGNFTKDRWEENVDGDRSEKGKYTEDSRGENVDGDKSEKEMYYDEIKGETAHGAKSEKEMYYDEIKGETAHGAKSEKEMYYDEIKGETAHGAKSEKEIYYDEIKGETAHGAKSEKEIYYDEIKGENAHGAKSREEIVCNEIKGETDHGAKSGEEIVCNEIKGETGHGTKSGEEICYNEIKEETGHGTKSGEEIVCNEIKKETTHRAKSEEEISYNEIKGETGHGTKSGEEIVCNEIKKETIHRAKIREEICYNEIKRETGHGTKSGEEICYNEIKEETGHGTKCGEENSRSEKESYNGEKGETVHGARSKEENYHEDKSGEVVHTNRSGEDNCYNESKGETANEIRSGEENFHRNSSGGENYNERKGETVDRNRSVGEHYDKGRRKENLNENRKGGKVQENRGGGGTGHGSKNGKKVPKKTKWRTLPL